MVSPIDDLVGLAHRRHDSAPRRAGADPAQIRLGQKVDPRPISVRVPAWQTAKSSASLSRSVSLVDDGYESAKHRSCYTYGCPVVAQEDDVVNLDEGTRHGRHQA